jgi:hypothetical protein
MHRSFQPSGEVTRSHQAFASGKATLPGRRLRAVIVNSACALSSISSAMMKPPAPVGLCFPGSPKQAPSRREQSRRHVHRYGPGHGCRRREFHESQQRRASGAMLLTWNNWSGDMPCETKAPIQMPVAVAIGQGK